MDPKNTHGTPEKRTFAVKELRVAPADGGVSRLSGHAAVFNELSEDMGGWFERIAGGAFAEAIASDDVRCLRDHEPCMILGRNKAGTLSLAEDAQGLAFQCDLPDTSYARDLSVSISRGDVSQCSFSFAVMAPEDETWGEVDGKVVRTILKAKLYDVSPVTYPAYPTTDVMVAQRSYEAFRANLTPPPSEGRSISHAARELELLAIE